MSDPTRRRHATWHLRRHVRSGPLRASPRRRAVPRAVPARSALVRSGCVPSAQAGCDDQPRRAAGRNARTRGRRHAAVCRQSHRAEPARPQLYGRYAGPTAGRRSRSRTVPADRRRFGRRIPHLARTAADRRTRHARGDQPRPYSTRPHPAGGVLRVACTDRRADAGDRPVRDRHPPARPQRPIHPLHDAPRRRSVIHEHRLYEPVDAGL